jgi:hypothetical protein
MDAHKQAHERATIPVRFSTFTSPLAMLVVLIVIVLATALAPVDRLLGSNLRLILLHGAWVWTGMILFAASAFVGLAALIVRRAKLHAGSLALSRAGLVFWLTYLPMSLLVMQMNWGGLYFDEPRWRIPFSFAVVALLLQTGLLLFDRRTIASAANLVFGVSLWYSLRSAETVLHPESPVAQSSGAIQVYFYLLLVLVFLLGIMLAAFFYRRTILHPERTDINPT